MVTPRELTTMLQARGELDKDVWFRTSWLATAVRATIWGQQPLTPQALLGWPDPSVEKKIRSFWAALPRAEERKH